MKKYNVCMVGIGAVGTEIVRLLRKREFPMEKFTVFATRERTEMIDGLPVDVKVATGPESFKEYDFAFFAGTEGALMPLAALHREAGIKRIVCCTYQAVSGSGNAAIAELDKQVRAWVAGEEIVTEVYPAQIAFNVVAQIGSEAKDLPGYTSEEAKLGRESRKILSDESIKAVSTCVRVPVFNGHSEAIHVEFNNPITPERAREVLAAAPGVQVVDDLANSVFPTPIASSGIYDCLVGRIRADDTVENGLSLFVAGDNIWKGAAQNAVQIAEKIIEMGLK